MRKQNTCVSEKHLELRCAEFSLRPLRRASTLKGADSVYASVRIFRIFLGSRHFRSNIKQYNVIIYLIQSQLSLLPFPQMQSGCPLSTKHVLGIFQCCVSRWSICDTAWDIFYLYGWDCIFMEKASFHSFEEFPSSRNDLSVIKATSNGSTKERN